MSKLLVKATDLGVLSYQKAWLIQEKLKKKLVHQKMNAVKGQEQASHEKEKQLGGYLLFVQHPHVYTLGKSGNPDNLLFSKEELAKHNVEVVKSDRGGDITYHGPGQLVGYPVLDLEKFDMGIAKYIHHLEEVVIHSLAHFGISSNRVRSRTGVWVGNNKICAFGIKCSRYVCMHGFALNVNPELHFFHGIVPCGIHDGGVTSMTKLTEKKYEMNQIRDLIVTTFKEEFGTHVIYDDSVQTEVAGSV